MKPAIARLYERRFKSAADASAFIEAANALIEDRISAVDMKYRLYQSDEDPLLVYELWEYLMKMLEWVKSSMEGASTIPRRFSPETNLSHSRSKRRLIKRNSAWRIIF